jgi:hypothetical protein
MKDPIDFDTVRSSLVRTANGMLAGSIDLITGTRELNRLRREGQLPVSHSFEVFETFESETDQYPVGAVRDEYSAELLTQLDSWASACVHSAEKSLKNACTALVGEYGTDSNAVDAGERE